MLNLSTVPCAGSVAAEADDYLFSWSNVVQLVSGGCHVVLWYAITTPLSRLKYKSVVARTLAGSRKFCDLWNQKADSKSPIYALKNNQKDAKYMLKIYSQALS